MTPDPIDPLLADYSRERLPDAPRTFQDGVWREIERRRRASFWSRMLPLPEFRELFGEPRLAAAAFTLALAVGAVPAAAWSQSRIEQRLARQSLHLNVFAAKPPFQLVSLTSSGAESGSR